MQNTADDIGRKLQALRSTTTAQWKTSIELTSNLLNQPSVCCSVPLPYTLQGFISLRKAASIVSNYSDIVETCDSFSAVIFILALLIRLNAKKDNIWVSLPVNILHPTM